jgi:hypothetical protein
MGKARILQKNDSRGTAAAIVEYHHPTQKMALEGVEACGKRPLATACRISGIGYNYQRISRRCLKVDSTEVKSLLCRGQPTFH